VIKESSIRVNAVLRGDEGAVVIGEGTNIDELVRSRYSMAQ